MGSRQGIDYSGSVSGCAFEEKVRSKKQRQERKKLPFYRGFFVSEC